MNDTERQDEGELTPEESQEKADEAREAFGELEEASVDVVNQFSFENVGKMLDNIDEGLYGLRPRGTKKTK